MVLLAEHSWLVLFYSISDSTLLESHGYGNLRRHNHTFLDDPRNTHIRRWR